MKILNKRIFFKMKAMVLALIVGLLSGCDDFLDINEDPNNPTELPLSQILPFTQVAMVNGLGMSTSGLGEPTSLYVHHLSEFSTLDNYGISGGEFAITSSWRQLYTLALTDLNVIIGQATEIEGEESYHYSGIAKIMTAYAYSLMVDVWGDIPYFDALGGADNPFPRFDDGEDIYADLFRLLDDGISDLDNPSILSPAADDLIYGGDLDKWRRFANTVKLRNYNTIRFTDLYDADAQAEVDRLINNADAELMQPEGDFELRYGTSLNPDNRHPGFIGEWQRGQRTMNISPYFYLILNGRSILNAAGNDNIFDGYIDPRIPYYWFNQLGTNNPEPQNPPDFRDGFFVSTWFGSIGPNFGNDVGDTQAVLGLYPVGGRYDDGLGGFASFTSNVGEVNGTGDIPQQLLPYHISLYIRAELALATPAPGNARALFVSAMQASMEKVNEIADLVGAPNISEENINNHIDVKTQLFDSPPNARPQLEVLLTEKWIANFGMGVEAFNDHRRTGYPEIYDPNTDGNPQTLRTASFTVSFPYKTDDLEINPNAPNQRNIFQDRVFWDQN